MPIDGLRIERVRNLTIDVMEAIAMEFGGDYTLRVAERHLQHPSYHLLCGFWEGEMVSLASVGIFAGYSRVDYVYTRTDFRGRGFAGAMLHHLIQYHRQLSTNHLYLYSSSPESIPIKAAVYIINELPGVWPSIGLFAEQRGVLWII